MNPFRLSPAPQGGVVDPRSFAVSGGSPHAGNRAAGEPFGDIFVARHVDLLWNALLNEWARTVDYWPQGDSAGAVPLVLLWKEGVEGEEFSPGRYSHAYVRNADLPSDPALRDALMADGVIYDVVRVDAFMYFYSSLVLQNREEDF